MDSHLQLGNPPGCPPQSQVYPPPGNQPNSQNPPELYKVMDGTEASWKKALTRQKGSRVVICVTAFVGLLAFCLVAFALQPIFLGAIAAMGIASGAASIATLIAIAVAIAAVVSAAAGYATHRIQEYHSSKPAKEYAAMNNPEFERIFSDIIKKEIFTELQNAAEALQGKPDNPSLMGNFNTRLEAFRNAFQTFCEHTHAVIMPFIPDPVILTNYEKDLVDMGYLNYVIDFAGMYTIMAFQIESFGLYGYANFVNSTPNFIDDKLSYRGKQLDKNQCLENAHNGLKKLLVAIKNRNPVEANDAIRAYNEARYGFCCIDPNQFNNMAPIFSGFNSSLLHLSDANIAAIENEINNYIGYLDKRDGTGAEKFFNFMDTLANFGIMGNAELDYRCISPDLCKKWKGILKKINNSSTFNANRDALKEFLAAVRDEYPDAFIPEIDFTKLKNDKNENLKQLAKDISDGLKNDKEFLLKNLINTDDFDRPIARLWDFVDDNKCGEPYATFQKIPLPRSHN
ncbi:MAG: hypothetical protein LBI69_00115 [Puniceicoccales bacterium]|jgi:hypothetical protein|nr:hypothetical protein [Puniceicoccales bacterium]